MKNLQLFLITLIAQKCCSEFVPLFQFFNPMSVPLAPMCPPTTYPASQAFHEPFSDNASAVENPKDNLKFLLPLLDMQIQCDRSLHVIQEQQEQQIYVLHGHDLYRLFVERQEKRLSWIAVLEGSVRHVESLGAQIISWQGSLLLVIALDEHLEIYQLDEEVLQQRAAAVKDPAKSHEPPPVFAAIQQLTLTGRFQKLFLFSPSEERIMIVAAVNFTKLYGKLRIFEWFNTYFDPIEEKTVPAMDVVNVIGSQTKYLITGRIIKHQPKTILTVYEISPNSTKFSVKQTLTIESHTVHMFSYLHRNIIVACSSKQEKCNSFRQMQDGHFGVYRQRTPKEFAFDQMAASTRFIAASRQNQILVFTNHRLDCFGSFVSDQKDVPSLIGLQNANKENYLLLVYKRPFQVLVRLVELEINVKDLSMDILSEPEEMLVSNQHQHLFEQTIGQLRSLLLRRKSDMDIFRKITKLFKPKLKDFEAKERTILRAGNVGVIRIVRESLNSPIQIIQKIENLRYNYLPQRSKRSETQASPNETVVDDTNRIKVKRMKVKSLIYQGDVIEGFTLNLTNNSNKVLNIETKVSTRFLNTSEVIAPQHIRDARQQTIPNLFFDLVPSGHINHLKVDFINGRPWDTFYNSLFLKSRDTFIEGSLVLESSVRVEHLTADVINGLTVSNLFNLKHPQIIHSELVISRFFANDLKAKTVNGLNFAEDIVFSGNDTFVETPVVISHLRISGDLFLPNNIKMEHFNPGEIKFQQFYTNKVIIDGSVVVNNLKTLINGAKIVIEGEEFNEHEVKRKYLLKDQAQNFSFPVAFEEAKVTALSLETNYLNDHPTDQHMLVNKQNSHKPLQVVFMNAQVKGDVILRDFKSGLAEIKENIIHPGDRVNITGQKVFQAPLEIINAEVVTLNGLPAKDLVFKHRLSANDFIRFEDTKVFSKIQVQKSTTINKQLEASYLNNFPLENLLSNDYYMDRLKVKNLVHATNLVFHKINGIPFAEFFSKLDVHNGRLVLHKDLIVEGNAQFVHSLNVEYINGINWSEYEKNLVRVNENAVIEGEVWFSEDLTITHKLETPQINGQDMGYVLKNVLLKSQPQVITGNYHFGNLRGSSANIFHINNVDVQNFVDLSRTFTEIEADLVVENLNVEGNLQGYIKGFEFFLGVKDKIRQFPFKPWKNLYVFNDASWPLNVADSDQQELLKYFYKSAVVGNRDQIISGNVKMFYPVINHMQTLFKFPLNLDLEYVQHDAVLKNSPARQVITGEKIFLKTLHMQTLKAFGNVDTKLLNEVEILRFNQSLYYATSPQLLKGPMKFLRPLTVKHLIVNGLVNGLDTSGIYQLQSAVTLPAVQLQQLFAYNNVTIENINDMNWSFFLNNRVTLRGPALEHFGHLTFENLIIEKHALIQSINGIAVDNLVFKHSPHLQIITGHKILQNSLVLAGPAHITHINDKDLMDLYHSSLLKDQNYVFNDLILEQAEFEQGLQVVSDVENNLQQRFLGENDEAASPNDVKLVKFLKEVRENLNNSYVNILYLDYDLNTTVEWLDTEDFVSANQTINHELARTSSCEKRYIQISLLQPNKIYLKNLTSQSLTQTSNKLFIQAENYCLQRKAAVKAKITLTGPKLLKVFGLKRFVETLQVFDNFSNPLEKFVILHALDLPNLKRNEVRIFKISLENNSIHDWQSLKQNIGIQVKYFKLSQMHILLTNGLADQHPAVTIYHFQNHTQLFKVQQVIDGNFDIMKMVALPNAQASKQLILSCYNCRRIFIYEFVSSPKDHKYEIQQIISLKSPIDKFVIFNLRKSFFMLVISQPGYDSYNIYKYSYIQGWLPVTFGYFPNLQLSLPLTELWTKHDDSLMHSKASEGLPLMLLCQPINCYVVKAIV